MITAALDADDIHEKVPELSTVSRSGDDGSITQPEIWIAGFVALVVLALRWFYARSYGWNSDEPQHLHVVWAWANGLLPYRDVFDNHSPLFQFLCSPVFAWLGERPDIVVPMRLLMVPLFGVSVWCIYKIGSAVFSP